VIGEQIAARMPLPEGAAEKLNAFDALLRAENQKMDLTAVTDPEEALYAHYLDSLAGAAHLPHGARVIDLGSGAGFPGLPLAIARPDLSFVLLDAQRKRVDFLSRAIAALGIAAEAVHARAEDYARAHREAADAVISRAVARLPVLLEWALPLVRMGGKCLLWKGPGIAEELADAARVSPLLGGGAPRVLPVSIPGRDWAHVLVHVEKQTETPKTFPRKAGMAMKRPL
jgi:16S rRNA (guanine527-N7)-methyltransferase